ARQILALRREAQALREPAPEPYAAAPADVSAPPLPIPIATPASNRVVEAWRRQHTAAGQP
ncbi:MAG TPA: hypothetical protein VFY19_09105, partial [Geminicoccaceae bacterium]|nr:hypothetical protein [Geminicoccaceae bacterium]